MYSRRQLLLGLASAGVALGAARQATAATRNRLLLLFLRGGADGLDILPPQAEPQFFDLRASTAPAASGLIGLDGHFALNPAAAALEPLYRNGRLAFVVGVGHDGISGSHFRSQDLLDAGNNNALNIRGDTQGWLTRYLNATATQGPALGDAFRGVIPCGRHQRSLNRYAGLVSVAEPGDLDLRLYGQIDLSRHHAALHQHNGPYYNSARRADALIQAVGETAPQERPVDHGAQYPSGRLGSELKLTAQLIKTGLANEVIALDALGWDLHTGLRQGMDRLLAELAGALRAFHDDLGPAHMAATTVICLSEFGRRAADNGSGSDHGRGGLLIALGGGVNGGQVHGDWPGLQQLDPQGNLPITTDTRSVLWEALARRMLPCEPGQVFPNFTPPTPGPGVFRS